MEPEIAIDLSIKPVQTSISLGSTGSSQILKPIPKPPWAIVWYQNLCKNLNNCNYLQGSTSLKVSSRDALDHNLSPQIRTVQKFQQTSPIPTKCKSGGRILGINIRNYQGDISDASETLVSVHRCDFVNRSKNLRNTNFGFKEESENRSGVVLTTKHSQVICDIATCDGPVIFDRVLNPNFAVTVEHHNSAATGKSLSNDGSPTSGNLINPSSNTYLCICCNQSFKSLFCYQKHKKRHLNPVTVDITSTNKILPLVTVSENRSKTKDLNVQFFPCKKCGCKFPSYYFVHKHKKVCHKVLI